MELGGAGGPRYPAVFALLKLPRRCRGCAHPLRRHPRVGRQLRWSTKAKFLPLASAGRDHAPPSFKGISLGFCQGEHRASFGGYNGALLLAAFPRALSI